MCSHGSGTEIGLWHPFLTRPQKRDALSAEERREGKGTGGTHGCLNLPKGGGQRSRLLGRRDQPFSQLTLTLLLSTPRDRCESNDPRCQQFGEHRRSDGRNLPRHAAGVWRGWNSLLRSNTKKLGTWLSANTQFPRECLPASFSQLS